MKKLFSAVFVTLVFVSIIPACTVRVCRRVVKECYIECNAVCCDRTYCWECDCYNVCYDTCYNDAPDNGTR